jgi:plastocyanin
MDLQPNGRGAGVGRPVLGAAAALVLVALATVAIPGPAETHVVEMRASQYQPARLTVRRGDAVVWVNRDQLPHNVTRQGAWDSGTLAPGARWSTVAHASGTYPYVCTLHPGMRGTLVVR